MSYFVRPIAHPRAPLALKSAAASLRAAPFVPHRLLNSGHVQTLLSQRPRRGDHVTTTETLALPSGMVVDAEVVAPTLSPQAPTVVCVHGMGGSPSSGYMRGMAQRAADRGWGAWLLNLYDLRAPSAGKPTVFHAGNSAALEEVVEAILVRVEGPVVLAGVSLGGNSTLKLLGEWKDAPPPRVKGAAVLSPLVDLVAAWPILERRSRAPYRVHFLQALCALVKEHEERLAPHVDLERVYRSTTIREFDSALTVPLGGYADVFDYYSRASAAPVVGQIAVPTLAIFSADDPVLPIAPLMAKAVRDNPYLLAALTAGGGHVGFVERTTSGDRSWAEDRAMEHFDHVTGAFVGSF